MGVGTGSTGVIGQQMTALRSIPATVLSYWGGWFTFSAVRLVEGMIIPMIPNPGGPLGQLVNAGIRGLVTTADMVTWDAIKAAGVSTSQPLWG